MSNTMQAMVLPQWGGELELVTRPIPEPGPGEVLLRVRACGVGYTLSNIRAGRLAKTPGAGVPRILGNEIVGEVVAVGSRVEGVTSGERGMTYFYLTCGVCDQCRWGTHDPLCHDLKGLVGVSIDGGFAEYTVVPAENFIPLPDEVSDLDGCATADALVTPWHALERVAPVGPGDTLVVVGAGGGVGIHAVLVGRLRGARVIGIDVTDEKLEFARSQGADVVVDGREADVAEAVREASGRHGADVVLDYVASEQTVNDALEYLAQRGRLVIQGVNPPGAELRVEPRRFITAETAITGARHASRAEYVEAARLVASGDLRPVVTRTVPLDRTQELFDLIDRRELLGRAAVVFPE